MAPVRIQNRNFWLAEIALLAQQLIVASSTVWLTRLILQISDGQVILTWLWLYLASLILPYFPGGLALVLIAKAKIQSILSYVEKFAQLYPGKIVEWTNKNRQFNKSSILSGEAHPIISEYIEYLYHLSSSGINVLLNLSVLAILIDPLLIASYIFGVMLSFLILIFQRKFKKRLAIKAQRAKIGWTALLLKVWDNILLNNSYNFNIWLEKASQSGKRLFFKTIHLEKFSQSASILMAFALILPSIFLVAYLAIQHIEDLAFISVLAVTLPRLFQVLNYSYELLFSVSEFPVQKARMNTVLSVVENLEPEDVDVLLKRVNWQKIKINGILDPVNLLEKLPSVGRVTIQGENGSGKTSLLLAIKKNYGNHAFYLPAKHNLLFKSHIDSVSTGQCMRAIFKEVKNLNIPFILLDEWDANLDKNNVEQLSDIIENLSLNHCVIEIRHAR